MQKFEELEPAKKACLQKAVEKLEPYAVYEIDSDRFPHGTVMDYRFGIMREQDARRMRKSIVWSTVA